MNGGGGAEERDVVGRRGFQAVAHDELAHRVQEVGRGGGGGVRRGRGGHCHGHWERSMADRWRGKKRPGEGGVERPWTGKDKGPSARDRVIKIARELLKFGRTWDFSAVICL